jgi:hypothetical protein
MPTQKKKTATRRVRTAVPKGEKWHKMPVSGFTEVMTPWGSNYDRESSAVSSNDESAWFYRHSVGDLEDCPAGFHESAYKKFPQDEYCVRDCDQWDKPRGTRADGTCGAVLKEGVKRRKRRQPLVRKSSSPARSTSSSGSGSSSPKRKSPAKKKKKKGPVRRSAYLEGLMEYWNMMKLADPKTSYKDAMIEYGQVRKEMGLP